MAVMPLLHSRLDCPLDSRNDNDDNKYKSSYTYYDRPYPAMTSELSDLIKNPFLGLSADSIEATVISLTIRQDLCSLIQGTNLVG